MNSNSPDAPIGAAAENTQAGAHRVDAEQPAHISDRESPYFGPAFQSGHRFVADIFRGSNDNDVRAVDDPADPIYSPPPPQSTLNGTGENRRWFLVESSNTKIITETIGIDASLEHSTDDVQHNDTEDSVYTNIQQQDRQSHRQERIEKWVRGAIDISERKARKFIDKTRMIMAKAISEELSNTINYFASTNQVLNINQKQLENDHGRLAKSVKENARLLKPLRDAVGKSFDRLKNVEGRLSKLERERSGESFALELDKGDTSNQTQIREDHSGLEAQLHQTRTQLDATRKQLQESQELLTTSQSQLTKSQNDLKEYRSFLSAATSQLRKHRNHIHESREQLETSQKLRAEIQAQLHQTEKQLEISRSEIREKDNRIRAFQAQAHADKMRVESVERGLQVTTNQLIESRSELKRHVAPIGAQSDPASANFENDRIGLARDAARENFRSQDPGQSQETESLLGNSGCHLLAAQENPPKYRKPSDVSQTHLSGASKQGDALQQHDKGYSFVRDTQKSMGDSHSLLKDNRMQFAASKALLQESDRKASILEQPAPHLQENKSIQLSESKSPSEGFEKHLDKGNIQLHNNHDQLWQKQAQLEDSRMQLGIDSEARACSHVQLNDKRKSMGDDSLSHKRIKFRRAKGSPASRN